MRCNPRHLSDVIEGVANADRRDDLTLAKATVQRLKDKIFNIDPAFDTPETLAQRKASLMADVSTLQSTLNGLVF